MEGKSADILERFKFNRIIRKINRIYKNKIIANHGRQSTSAFSEPFARLSCCQILKTCHKTVFPEIHSGILC